MAAYLLIPKNAGGDFAVPDGWSRVGIQEMYNPEIQAAMGSLFTGPEVVDAFNKGDMVMIREGGNQVRICLLCFINI